MRTSIRTTDSAPLLMSFSTPKKYNAEDCFQVVYDDEKQIVYFMGGGGSVPKNYTRSRKYGTRRYTSSNGSTWQNDDPSSGQDD